MLGAEPISFFLGEARAMLRAHAAGQAVKDFRRGQHNEEAGNIECAFNVLEAWHRGSKGLVSRGEEKSEDMVR